jgi:hypothetical protein
MIYNSNKLVKINAKNREICGYGEVVRAVPRHISCNVLPSTVNAERRNGRPENFECSLMHVIVSFCTRCNESISVC